MARALYLDVEQGRFVSGLDSGLLPPLDTFFQGDNASYELYFLKRATAPAPSFYEPLDYSARSVKFAIGAPPPSGALYVAQDTWGNTSSVVTATVARTVTGGASTNEQQTVTFAPAAYDGTFALTVPSRTITVSSVSAGVFTTSGNHGLALLEPFTLTGFTTPTGFSNGNTLFVAALLSSTTLFAAPTPTTTAVTGYTANGGTIRTITATTPLLSARATGLQVQAALEQLTSVGEGNISVVASPGSSYRLAYQGAKQQTLLPVATVAAALTPIYAKTATINFSTSALQNAISASASVDAVLEIETTDGSEVETLVQAPITLLNDIIEAGSVTPVTGTTSFTLLAPDSSTWSVSIDNDGSLTATKQ
jgi:hypothetical protein